MSSDNGSEDREESSEVETGEDEGVRERLGEEADRAVERFDESIVDLLSWILDTETRARIYVFLRQNPHSTSDEIADGTGLYPSTVREALAELHEEEKVDRRKRQSGGAGNNPYEYTAMAPSELVTGIAGDVQSELNTVFNLDDHLDSDGDDEDESAATTEDTPAQAPVTITVDEESSDEE